MAAALPVAAFLSAHGFSAILVLIGASFLYLPLSGSIAPLPADLAAFVVIAAYAIDLSCRGPVRVRVISSHPSPPRRRGGGRVSQPMGVTFKKAAEAYTAKSPSSIRGHEPPRFYLDIF